MPNTITTEEVITFHPVPPPRYDLQASLKEAAHALRLAAIAIAQPELPPARLGDYVREINCWTSHALGHIAGLNEEVV